MKKVKYISKYINYDGLTTNKVYDVIKVHKGIISMITIINDHGRMLAYDQYDYNYNKLFEDVTHTYRNDIIDSIIE